VVKLLMTNLGLFDVTPGGFALREIAPGYSPEEVQAVTEAELLISPDLIQISGTG
ncbi:MAG TPA: succinyl-CoA--3-ketoacid-CoA transferase, partial [Dehalococcoidia bacterium]|nr:succinyl-CoA--3-ketoacid-CoA transferase [Dehalococcoidia bacterium]